LIILLLTSALLVTGCSPRKGEGAVVATVNGDPIFTRELKRELSNMVKQNPSIEINKTTAEDLLDSLIMRKLIIQEAMDRKMSEEKGFADTIKAFWEQTLIRNFVDRKTEELNRYVFVTDKEIEDYYNVTKAKTESIPSFEELRERIKKMIKQRKKSAALEEWLEEKKKKSKIHINQNKLSEVAQK